MHTPTTPLFFSVLRRRTRTQGAGRARQEGRQRRRGVVEPARRRGVGRQPRLKAFAGTVQAKLFSCLYDNKYMLCTRRRAWDVPVYPGPRRVCVLLAPLS